jgi:hypothetical protein
LSDRLHVLSLAAAADEDDAIRRDVERAELSEKELDRGAVGDVQRRVGVVQQQPRTRHLPEHLAELKGDNGRHLGPMGSRIVAEVFVGLLEASQSYLKKPGWKPTLPAKTSGTFTMTDLLAFVGDLSPLDGVTTP